MKYGVDNWTHEWVASTCTEENALYIEALLIAEYNTVTPYGYNVVPNSDSISPMIYETTKDRHREAMKSVKVSAVSTSTNLRRWKTDRARFIEILNTPEVKKRQSEASKALWSNPEKREKLLESRKLSITREYRAKQSETAKRIFSTDEQKQKRSKQASERWSNREYADNQAELIRQGYYKRIKEVGLPRSNKYRCLECGIESTACGIGNHQKKTNHIGKEKI